MLGLGGAILGIAFACRWTRDHSRDELIQGGYNVTTNVDEMNIYVNESEISTRTVNYDYIWLIYGFVGTNIAVFIVTIIRVYRKQKAN